LKLPELVKEKIHGTGEFGALFLKLADLTVVFPIKLDVAGDKDWDLGSRVFVHVNILGKTANGLLELGVANPLLSKKFNRFLGLDAGARINIILSGAVELKGCLRSDLRVVILLKAFIDDTLQASKSVAKEEVLFILGVEGRGRRRGRGRERGRGRGF
jgi:hypothetical protein